MKKKIEILAPAGSFECLRAAILSGADAVYLGGEKFGARAMANNFTTQELIEAINFAHLHNRQIYLTINTLVKEKELKEEMYDYLLPLYEAGLDAVIVQDLGVLQFVKKNFKDLPIHCSTQMTVTHLLGAKFLEKEGVERVVTSREMSLNEIKEIAKHTNLEIESFVHGALCYAYSGQCLYSSMLGGRSGNRGMCAQPCRLSYQDENANQGYFMSLKDICSLQNIPQLIEGGIYSFKIEGRMKKPEYVASVVSMYRKYVDLYYEKGKKGYQVAEEDLNILRDIFNRGEFHDGYYFTRNGQEMITYKKPSHAGVAALKVIKQQNNLTFAKALVPLNKGDVFELPFSKDDYTIGKAFETGEVVELSLRKGTTYPKNTILNRTRNNHLIRNIQENLQEMKLQEAIKGVVSLSVDAPARLTLTYKDFVVEVEGALVQQAQKQPLEETRVLKQLKKTGDAPFVFEDLVCNIDGAVFLPLQQLNELRRQGLEALEEAITASFVRPRPQRSDLDPVVQEQEKPREITVSVEEMEQLEVAIERKNVNRIYVDCNITTAFWANEALQSCVKKAKEMGKTIHLMMPHVMREQTVERYKEVMPEIEKVGFSGMVIRNLESYEFLMEQGYKGKISLDYHVYTFNQWSQDYWNKKGCDRTTIPIELSKQEMLQVKADNQELMVYGYVTTMISAQCMRKTTYKCDHISTITKLKDRKNMEVWVKNCCEYCYNITYSLLPISYEPYFEEVEDLKIRSLRYSFTRESGKEMDDILNHTMTKEYSSGNFKRGVI